MPVTINVHPVIIPALCSNVCQFSFNIPLYASLTHSTIPVTEITKYNTAIVNTAHQPFVPANKK